MATIRITNLKLKTIIGIFGWERKVRQSVIINIAFDYDVSKAAKSDDIKNTVDYKAITKDVIDLVNGSRYYLLEKLTAEILKLVLSYPKIQKATVRVDKPGALRFADSVSVELTKKK